MQQPLTMYVNKLKNWCKGEAVDERHALLVVVSGSPEISKIEDVLQTIKCLGRVRVRGRMLSETSEDLLVLCECHGTVTDVNVPPEVQADEGAKAWPIYIVPEVQETTDEFSVKLQQLLQAEGKSMEDMQALFPGPENPPGSVESIIRAVGDLLDKTAKPTSESGGYRRLRTFSGTVPTPAGEESFDHWMEQAYLMVEESDCAPKEKRRRILERRFAVGGGIEREAV